MIPVLYKSDETNFDSNGIGLLRDCISAHVTEQRNGKFVLEFVYPVTGQWFDQIKEDCIVKAKPNDIAADQLFRIYQSTKPIDGKVTFNARHISYDLAYNPLPKTTLSGNAPAVLNQILEGGLNAHPFTGFSDSTTESSSEVGPCTVREALGGKEGSLLDNWGGEYEFDNFVVRHHVQRGRDTGVLVEYGKNLTDFNQERALADVFTSVYAYAKKQNDDETERLITLDDQILHLSSEGSYPIKRTLMLDLSDNPDVTDAASLNTAAEKYAKDNKIDHPSVSWSIKFQNLRKTEDYKDVAILETCSLCDYVAIRFRQYSVDVRAEIIETDYNVLLEQYNSMDLGDPVSNFITDYQNQQKKTQKQFDQTTNFFTDAIDRATKAITGASGGYVRLIPSRNPQQIVIMDTPDINTAMRVWRWNLGGLGYSKNGYNGPYELAMTMNGEIVADFITAGVLRAIDIEGVHIKGANIEGAYFHAPGDFDMSEDSSMRNYISEWEGTAEGGEDKWLGFASKGGFVFAYLTGQTTTTPIPYEEIMAIMRGKINVYADLRMNGAIITLDNNGWSGGTKNQIYENADDEYLTLDSTKGIQLIERTGDDSEVMLCASRDLHNRMTIDTYGDIDMHGWILKNANIQDGSLEELKQDIVPYEESALDTINKIKIYRFRFKKDVSEDIDHKKYGPIISDKRQKLPEEILSYDGKGIDAYNERHLMMKAIQELSDKVDRLEKRITELEGVVKHAD